MAEQKPPLGGTRLIGDGPGETERADAARNRALLLDAATELLDTRPANEITMEDVARAAGVGKGTVFRRFGSRTGLMQALLDHHEKRLQRDVISGPPPLGPGAAPLDRLAAFGRARLDMVRAHPDLAAAAEDTPERYTHPTRAFYVMHVAMLLRTAGFTGPLDVLVHAVLAPLGAAAVQHLTVARGLSIDDVADEYEAFVRALTPRPGA